MGLYDSIKGLPSPGQFDDQVKAWKCNMDELGIGDTVPNVGTASSYSILLRNLDGGAPLFVHVLKNQIVEIGNRPLVGCPIFDKWGGYYGQGAE